MVRPKTMALSRQDTEQKHSRYLLSAILRSWGLVGEGGRGNGVLQVGVGQSTSPAIDDVAGDGRDLATGTGTPRQAEAGRGRHVASHRQDFEPRHIGLVQQRGLDLPPHALAEAVVGHLSAAPNRL